MSNIENPSMMADPAAARRAEWMRVLALADADDLAKAMSAIADLPDRQWLRVPETGMTMVQGRSGGTGMRFNLGEMTVTRCALTLADGTVGLAYVQGRSARHAEHAALGDALMQTPRWHDIVETTVLAPLRRSHAARLSVRAAAVAQSRVDFFTMERGGNNNA